MTWIIPLIGAIGEIAKNFVERGKSKKQRQAMLENFSKEIIKTYNTSNKGMRKSVALLSSWQIIVSRVIALDRAAARWSYTAILAEKYDVENVFSAVLTADDVNKALAEAQSTQEAMAKIQGEGALSWDDVRVDIESAMSAIILTLSQMKRKFDAFGVPSNQALTKPQILEISGYAEEVQRYTLVFFVYWNAILTELAGEQMTANTTFIEFIYTNFQQNLKTFADGYPSINSVSALITNATNTLQPIFRDAFEKKDDSGASETELDSMVEASLEVNDLISVGAKIADQIVIVD